MQCSLSGSKSLVYRLSLNSPFSPPPQLPWVWPGDSLVPAALHTCSLPTVSSFHCGYHQVVHFICESHRHSSQTCCTGRVWLCDYVLHLSSQLRDTSETFITLSSFLLSDSRTLCGLATCFCYHFWQFASVVSNQSSEAQVRTGEACLLMQSNNVFPSSCFLFSSQLERSLMFKQSAVELFVLCEIP